MTKNNNDEHIQIKETFFSRKKIFMFLGVIVISAFIVRIYFLNFEIPLTNDALNYFFYALDIKINNQIPVNYSPANPGWGIFLSAIFSNFESQSVIDYMNLQKMVSAEEDMMEARKTTPEQRKKIKKRAEEIKDSTISQYGKKEGTSAAFAIATDQVLGEQ